MIDPWLQILLVAYVGISFLVLDWAWRRDRETRTIKLLPFTDNQFDQYAEKLQRQMVLAHTIPGWLLRQRPWKDKAIFEIRSTPTGEVASVSPVPEVTIRMEPVMHHEPSIVKSHGIIIDPDAKRKPAGSATRSIDHFRAWEQHMMGWTP